MISKLGRTIPTGNIYKLGLDFIKHISDKLLLYKMTPTSFNEKKSIPYILPMRYFISNIALIYDINDVGIHGRVCFLNEMT